MVNLTFHLSGGNDEASLFVFDAMSDIVSLFQTLLNSFGFPHSLFPVFTIRINMICGTDKLCTTALWMNLCWVTIAQSLCASSKIWQLLITPNIHPSSVKQWFQHSNSWAVFQSASRINLFTYRWCWQFCATSVLQFRRFIPHDDQTIFFHMWQKISTLKEFLLLCVVADLF